ncbi:MAG: hypothetical protein JWO36_5070 [Myxococcales bacterium]|nr:hypothetical protein [Myxococcales bacterium]
MKNLAYAFTLTTLLSIAPACIDDPSAEDIADDQEVAGDGKADTSAPVVTTDNLNGQWVTTIAGQKQTSDTVIESWSAVGIRIHFGAKVIQATRLGDKLTAPGLSIDVKPNKAGVKDDTLDGTIDGQAVHFDRDVSVKPPITVAFPGDRPYRKWLTDIVLPQAQLDRESYISMDAATMLKFLQSCELYKHGSWLRTYFKGATFAEQATSFRNVVYAIDHMTATPRQMTSLYKFSSTLQTNLKDPTKVGLAMSTFSMYFTTAAGRALRMPITPDSTAYFITDRPVRGAKIGLVVMATPTHGPLASTFGRQLLDMGAMPVADNRVYARTMMELMIKSSNQTATALSPTGRSALTDWFSVMAIEDYRGVAFGNANLGWGYNMTNVQFYGLVVRALARATAVDSTSKPVIGQVIVGTELRPGDPSYADVLNGGNDMQEYPDMAQLKVLATSFLRQAHPQQVAAVEAAFAGVVPKNQLDFHAQQDVFHYITAQLYDAQGRTANLTGASADAAIAAVVALVDVLYTDSAGFEAYVLAHGITKSNVAAPKSTGF